MSQALRERAVFLRSFLRNPRQVGAILPTSRSAVRDMLDLADLPTAKVVVEMGAGSGSHTAEILARMAPDARLLAFEVDPELSALLETPDEPRLQVITDSAESVAKYLDGAQADVIISALPFTSLPNDTGRRILAQAREVLGPDGVMVVLQYSPLLQRELERIFPSVRRRFSPINVPPAFLFRCDTSGGAPPSASS